MKYKMMCPMCTTMMSVDAADETEAMSKMKDAGKQHMDMMHKDAPMMSDEDMEKMIKERWTTEM